MHRSIQGSAYLSVLVAAIVASGCGPGAPYRAPGFTPQEAEWEGYHDAQREGRLEEAATGFESMCLREDPYPRACYDHSRALEDAGRLEEAVESATRFIIEHPGSALAPSAATRIARIHEDLGRPDEGVEVLEKIASEVKGKDAWDSVIYEIAGIHRGAGAVDLELAALDRIRKKGRWGSQLWDNSIWRMIRILDEQGDRKRREALLVEMIAAREESHLIASYESPHNGDAMLELGRLYLDDGRLAEARGMFMDLASWKTSRLRDDGYLWAARVDLREGKVGKACKKLAKIVDKMPAANTRREATELFRSSGCR